MPPSLMIFLSFLHVLIPPLPCPSFDYRAPLYQDFSAVSHTRRKFDTDDAQQLYTAYRIRGIHQYALKSSEMAPDYAESLR